MVDFFKARRLVDDGEKPPLPGEHFGVVAFKELAVEIVDEPFHGLLGFDVVLAAPPPQRPGFA